MGGSSNSSSFYSNFEREAGCTDKWKGGRMDRSGGCMGGRKERMKEKVQEFLNNGVTSCYCTTPKANLHKTTYCLQLTVCTTLLSNDLVTGHCESVDYSRFNNKSH